MGYIIAFAAGYAVCKFGLIEKAWAWFKGWV